MGEKVVKGLTAIDACCGRGAPTVIFFLRLLHYMRSSIFRPKTDFGKNAYVRTPKPTTKNKTHGLGRCKTKNIDKKRTRFEQYLVKESRQSEEAFSPKCATSIVARVTIYYPYNMTFFVAKTTTTATPTAKTNSNSLNDENSNNNDHHHHHHHHHHQVFSSSK